MARRALWFNVTSNIFFLIIEYSRPFLFVGLHTLDLFIYGRSIVETVLHHGVGFLLIVSVCTCGDTCVSTKETASASFCHLVTTWVLYDMQCTSSLPFTYFGTNLWPCVFYLFLEGIMFVMMKILRIKTKAK
jgi:hypothetical protein